VLEHKTGEEDRLRVIASKHEFTPLKADLREHPQEVFNISKPLTPAPGLSSIHQDGQTQI
jgi:hypothetical protein